MKIGQVMNLPGRSGEFVFLGYERGSNHEVFRSVKDGSQLVVEDHRRVMEEPAEELAPKAKAQAKAKAKEEAEVSVEEDA
jgi:hypothetical protein